ncbi:MAG TPA: integrase [Rhizobiales bacterium]|nr:integrase [Hyphomicrobiales bacterium]
MHQDRPDPSQKDLTKAGKEGFDQRLEELDSFAAILPQGRNETLAHLLEDEDVATLRHLAHEGMGANSLRALASDFGYLQAWCRVATGYSLTWPAPKDLVLKFIAHHLWSEEEKAQSPDHGMPKYVGDHLRQEGLLRTSGPHSPGTVQRRLASWSTLHSWRSLEGPFSSPAIRAAIRLAVRVADRPRKRKSKKPITADILEEILKTCLGEPPMRPSLRDHRDAAILMLGFASGGRRRSELAGLRLSQIQFEDPVLADPNDTNSELLPCLTLSLGRTKTEDGQDDNDVVLIGRPVHALQDWLKVAKVKNGTIFRAINQWGHLSERPLSAQSINLIIKGRIKKAGLNPDDYSAHGLRSGFLTEAANRDIPLQDAMLQSRHKSVIQASRYYSEASKSRRKSARMLG